MTASITPRQSKVIDFLRFPLAAAVVLLHAGESRDGFYAPGVYPTIELILSQGICRIAVPCFFFFSGFLFFSKLRDWDTKVWLDKVKKRVRTLFVPYILWNLLALLISFGYSWIRFWINPVIAPASFIETFQNNGGINIFWGSNSGLPIDYPLWFIRDLIVITAITPLVYGFVKGLRIWGVMALFVGIALIGAKGLEGLFFYTLGAFFQLSDSDFLQVFSRFKWLAYLFCLAGIVLIAYSYRDYPVFYQYVRYLFVLAGTVSVINLTAAIVDGGKPKANAFLISSSFFIYASHGILILHDFAHYITLHLLPFESVTGKCLVLFVKAALAVSICLSLFAIMKKWTPKTLGVLTGNRV